jgi:oxygen-dependent protoporphyrinogen oxidase
MTSRSVIVVGAGIAGLTTAYYLSKLGIEVTVLEASGQVGGRMSTDLREGYLIDRGVQFLSNGYSIINELIKDLGMSKNLSGVSGWAGTVRDGSIRRTNFKYPWTIATSGLLGLHDTFRLAKVSRSLVIQTKHLSLSNYSEWQELDDEDAAEWIAASFGKGILEYVFEPMLEGFYFQQPENMSRAWPAIMWNFGARIKGITTLTGGNGSLPETLAQNLKVYLNTPAEAIDTNGDGVIVNTPSGIFQAGHVVLAAAASGARQLYSPGTKVENNLLNTEYSATLNISFAFPEGISRIQEPKKIYGLLVPRRERQVIAAISFESQKCRQLVPRGELLNVMLCGSAGRRLLTESEDSILAEVLPDLQRFFPGIDKAIGFAHFSRWAQAEPRSPIGRSRDIYQYRRFWNKEMKVILAGDYMSIPCSEGAAESGKWAAYSMAGILPSQKEI